MLIPTGGVMSTRATPAYIGLSEKLLFDLAGNVGQGLVDFGSVPMLADDELIGATAGVLKPEALTTVTSRPSSV